MENDQRRIAADGEFELPEEIIQHIQSLLLERDAGRTSLLSKSWHRAWCSRPNLCFNQYKFRNRVDEFPIFTKKTMQRYEDLNLKIKSLKLWMDGNDDSLARELILKAIKLGAIDLSLTIEFSTSDTSRCFVLPDEVLESETLARLSVLGLTIDLERRNKAVACSNLKFLKLSHATVKGDLIWDLIWRCPSIEELTLDHTKNLFGDERRSNPSHDRLEFHNLKCLRLIGLDVKLHELWNKSPCLKVLVIWDYDSEYARICSSSLEHITIRILHNRIWKGEFDVPNIRKFKISCGSFHVPRLKIKSSGREWEIKSSGTDMDINGSFEPISSLNQLVKTQRLSRFSVSVVGHYWEE